MTAPIDPRPYAAPTDLVTAADVARWLHEIDDDDITGGDPMWLTISRLDARLDRERRQACRRGALDCWRGAMVCLGDASGKRVRRVGRSLGTLPLIALDAVLPRNHWRATFVLLDRAIAFRAAARQP